MQSKKGKGNKGRPKTKGPLRNFKLRNKIDSFLVDESGRDGRDMTAIVEAALNAFSKLKPSVRDAEIMALFRDTTATP